MGRPVTAYRTLDVPVDGGTLRVGVWGEAGPVVLAVHGITANHRTWDLVADRLPDLRMVAPDLRGRGRSATLPGPFGMARHAADLAAVLAAVAPGPAPGPAVVLGHSMGAFVAVTLAHTQPDRVARLVLVDGGLPLTPPPGLDDAAVLAAVLGPAAERLSMTFPTRAAYQDFWRVHPAFAADWGPAVARYVDYDLTGAEPALRPSPVLAAVQEDSAEIHSAATVGPALAALAHPTVFLRAPRGLRDEPPGLYPEPEVAAWAARLPGLRWATVPDVNHYTVLLADRGADAVAAEVSAAVAAEVSAEVSPEVAAAVAGEASLTPAATTQRERLIAPG